MSEAKEKDRILAQIKARKHHGEIVGLNKHIDVLVKNGYVSGSFATDGSIITIRITPQGERFLENGGYARLSKTQTKRRQNVVQNGCCASLRTLRSLLYRAMPDGCSEDAVNLIAPNVAKLTVS